MEERITQGMSVKRTRQLPVGYDINQDNIISVGQVKNLMGLNSTLENTYHDVAIQLIINSATLLLESYCNVSLYHTIVNVTWEKLYDYEDLPFGPTFIYDDLETPLVLLDIDDEVIPRENYKLIGTTGTNQRLKGDFPNGCKIIYETGLQGNTEYKQSMLDIVLDVFEGKYNLKEAVSIHAVKNV